MEISDNTKEKLQNWFNIMWKHANQMEKPSRNSCEYDNRCMYRAEDGNKCLVGALISDEKYNPEIERKSPDDELIKSLLDVEEEIEIDFLIDCQHAHDFAPHLNPRFKSYMLQKLSNIAFEYKLTLPEEGANS